jgi:hypothetical protein
MTALVLAILALAFAVLDAGQAIAEAIRSIGPVA